MLKAAKSTITEFESMRIKNEEKRRKSVANITIREIVRVIMVVKSVSESWTGKEWECTERQVALVLLILESMLP